MNWDAIGGTAEVIGSVAVFVTLIYLAIQTRDNVRVIRTRAVWDAQLSFAELNQVLGDDGVVCKVVYKAMNTPEALTDYERYLLHRFLRGWLQRMEAQYALYKAGISILPGRWIRRTPRLPRDLYNQLIVRRIQESVGSWVLAR